MKCTCKAHIGKKRRRNSTDHPSRSNTTVYYIFCLTVCTVWVRTLQLLRLKTFGNELCQLCTVCSSEALWCSGEFAQHSVWFQNCIQRNKFSCRVTIAVLPLIALPDRSQAASREGNKSLPWPWLEKCNFPVFVSGLELPDHRV